MVKPLLLVGMIGIHLHLLPERMELTPGNVRHNRLCDGTQQLDECVRTRACSRVCLCLSRWSMSVSEEVSFIHVSMCATVHVTLGRGWPCRIKVCHRGESAAPSLLLSLARSTGTAPLAVWVCVCVCASLRGLLCEVGCSLVPSDPPWTTIYW